jgi:cysteine synthase A
MQKIATNILETIGRTPIVEISPKINTGHARILVKIESFNPGGSIKDRAALSMINDAERSGLLKKGMRIIEPTSGNTGIGLAMVAAVKGYELILTMPETMSIERRKLLSQYGAKIVLTPGKDAMAGAIEKAKELEKTLGGIILQQFENLSNPKAHFESTGPEIWEACDGNIDAFISAVGTGGTLTGAGKYLKLKNDKIKIVAVEPDTSRVLSGGKSAPHKIQGIGAGFIPKTCDTALIDEVFHVSIDESLSTAKIAASSEGILMGISSGASLYAALEISKSEEFKGKTIVAILPDTGERYLSTELFDSN